jgi:hypothetical protein
MKTYALDTFYPTAVEFATVATPHTWGRHV